LLAMLIRTSEMQERVGLTAGIEWLSVADLHVFYVDLGVSEGMRRAAKRAQQIGIQVEFRRLYDVEG
jgi:hypothetical protein